MRLEADRDFVELAETDQASIQRPRLIPPLSYPPKQAHTIYDVAIFLTSGSGALATLDEPAKKAIHHGSCKKISSFLGV